MKCDETNSSIFWEMSHLSDFHLRIAIEYVKPFFFIPGAGSLTDRPKKRNLQRFSTTFKTMFLQNYRPIFRHLDLNWHFSICKTLLKTEIQILENFWNKKHFFAIHNLRFFVDGQLSEGLEKLYHDFLCLVNPDRSHRLTRGAFALRYFPSRRHRNAKFNIQHLFPEKECILDRKKRSMETLMEK